MTLFRGLPDTQQFQPRILCLAVVETWPKEGEGWNASRIADDATVGNAALYNLDSGVGGEGRPSLERKSRWRGNCSLGENAEVVGERGENKREA